MGSVWVIKGVQRVSGISGNSLAIHLKKRDRDLIIGAELKKTHSIDPKSSG